MAPCVAAFGEPVGKVDVSCCLTRLTVSVRQAYAMCPPSSDNRGCRLKAGTLYAGGTGYTWGR
ncbi:hypothetical protein MSHI_25540 [Mycobacterium shinjukuense]|uniref:Uncharacterized protein n=1 Tax=Mycobacterium shinjukuense TaxID=398694 RepID=A0A7I7MQY5_9MYCO|nr:hypothetical protein MSHI_25540 [Mycobacterium shinjukuense]